jgi:dolichol kinase
VGSADHAIACPFFCSGLRNSRRQQLFAAVVGSIMDAGQDARMQVDLCFMCEERPALPLGRFCGSCLSSRRRHHRFELSAGAFLSIGILIFVYFFK